jgi:DNA-binding MarR family transcriptional regulator
MYFADDAMTGDVAEPSALRAADTLRRTLTRIHRQLRRLRADHGVSPSKLMILSQLMRAGVPLAAVDLARLERLQPQSLTRIIAELETRGLVTRRPSETDRRQVLIDITPAGCDLLITDARQQSAWLAAAIDTKLSGTEQGLLMLAVPLLARLVGEGER